MQDERSKNYEAEIEAQLNFGYLQLEDIAFHKQMTFCSLINLFTNKNNPRTLINQYIGSLKTLNYVDSIFAEDDMLSIVSDGKEINAFNLSKILPVIGCTFPELETEQRFHMCHNDSIKLIRFLHKNNIKCSLVFGTMSHSSNKAPFFHSWIEIIKNGKECVIDTTMNLFIKKESYYWLRNANPINKIDSQKIVDDAKIMSQFSEFTPVKLPFYLCFRDEIVKDLSKNQQVFEK